MTTQFPPELITSLLTALRAKPLADFVSAEATLPDGRTAVVTVSRGELVLHDDARLGMILSARLARAKELT